MKTTSFPQKLGKSFLIKGLVAVFIFIGIILVSSSASAQCGSCDVQIEANGNPTGTMKDGATVCITGKRTKDISFGNKKDITICIADGASWDGEFEDLKGLKQINNFGNLTLKELPKGKWEFFNFHEVTFKDEVEVEGTFKNFGKMIVEDELKVSSNATFESNGVLIVKDEVTFESNSKITLIGQSEISDDLEIKSNTEVDFSGSLKVKEDLKIESNSLFNVLNSNSCNNLQVGEKFENDGVIQSNSLNSSNSPLFVTKKPSKKEITGAYSIGNCTTSSCVETQTVTSSTMEDVVYIFRCSGTIKIPGVMDERELVDMDVTVIGGGAGGGMGEAAGGGGAGGIFERTAISLQKDKTYYVSVGAGGNGAFTLNNQGKNGTSSAFFGISALGGGGGGSNSEQAAQGLNGASGGGSAAEKSNNSKRITNNGNGNSGNNGNGNSGNNGGNSQETNGGSNSSNQGIKGNSRGNGNFSGNGNQINGGGGGGAGSAGESGKNNNPGTGGNGVSLNILEGISLLENAFAGGGGATGRNPSQKYGKGTGGSRNSIKLGGDADHKDPSDNSTDGIGEAGKANTGSGGGAGNLRGGAGSSGIVIIRANYRILPVEFIYLNAKLDKENRKTNLEWAMSQYSENYQFVIERAVDQVQTWDSVGTVKSNQSPESFTYQFTDADLPKGGGNVYYRIKQIYNSEKGQFSSVASIQLEAISATNQWQVYPNPVNRQRVQIQNLGKANSNQALSLRVFSPSGRVYSETATSLSTLGNQLDQFLQTNQSGVYIVEISQGDRVERHRVLN